MCYTYDNLNRVTKRTIKNLSNVILSEETYSYDAAGNDATNTTFGYGSNSRLTSAGLHTYTYNVENVRISNLFDDFDDTTYVYDTRTKLSKLLIKNPKMRILFLFHISVYKQCNGATR